MKKYLIAAISLAVIASACKNKQDGHDKHKDSGHKDTSTMAKTETPAEPEPDQETQMKNYMAYAAPGAPHEMMKSWDGEWDARVITFGMGPQPDTSMGKAVNKTIMGGRYQVSNFTGTMMGSPFEGMSTLAYDNDKKIFMSTWIDNMGTGIMMSEGPWDDATKTITLKGKMHNAGNGKEEDFRQTLKVVDDNTQVSEMYSNKGGQETKWMEITYTRKKGKK